MKAKNLWLVLITFSFFGCDDNTGGLGIGMLPGSDGIIVGTKKFNVITQDTLSGAVYAKTNIGYVGRFTDNEHEFGYYEGSFLTELNCVDSLTFPKAYDDPRRNSPDNMIGNIDESLEQVRLVLGYYSFFGDSLSPMQVSIYELDHNLEKDHYTNIDPSEFTTKTRLLGRKSFSAVDLADSTRHEKDHLHQVVIPVGKELGKRIINENWNNPETFKNSETFKKFFKGLYVTSEIGDGTVLYIDHLQLEVVFRSFQLDSIGSKLKKYNPETEKYDGADSTYLSYRSFASTMEVIQANNIKVSEDKLQKKVDENDSWTYLKSPAGIYTRAILPIDDIMDKNRNGIDMEQDTINAVKLVFNAYYQEAKNEYSMSPPKSILLIREKEVDDFFKNNELPNSTTSYTTDISNNTYTFTNIMRLVTSLAKEMEEAKKEAGNEWDEKKWLDENALAIIPVAIGRTTTSSNTTIITNVRHDLKPTYVKLKGGNTPLELQVVYSRFNK